MKLIDIIKRRKSVRKFLTRPVPREDIIKCIEAARLAPSAHNLQPWRFIVIDEGELKRAFSEAVCSGIYSRTRFIERAPAVIVILAKLDLITSRVAKAVQGTAFYLIDLGIAGEHIVLQAQELGLGTCWIGWFNARKAAKFLKVPQGYRVVSMIAMGYPAQGGVKHKQDLPLEEILFFNNEAGKKLS